MMATPTPNTLLPLLPTELYLKNTPAVSAINFFDIHSKASSSAVVDHLQSRLDAIGIANPWLSGRLVATAGGSVSLDYSAPTRLVLDQVSLPHLEPNMPYDALLAAVEPFKVDRGAELLASASSPPLFRVVWISISPTSAALYISLSHMVGDGYTYYRLCEMLGEAAAVMALTPARVADFVALVRADNDTMALHRSVSMLCNMATTVLVSAAPTTSVHTISAEWVASEKANAASSFVSTNDVITSWFFRKCHADVGFMVRNMRGRLPRITHDLAGNYGSIVGYQPPDFATPDDIRASIAPGRRVHSGPFPYMFTKTTAMITSWASLYRPVTLATWCTNVAHFPCATASHIAPYTNTAVVFRKTKESLGVIMRTRTVDTDTVDPAWAPSTTKTMPSVAASS
ncbi:Aste57867_12688 [Aphanomyces stellatus]|uniref:Aste57867_12688 protein n=1 Tax=Aphanomyces stellatus TaxID=120398 RepID=A0A485KXK7_9STRA|nr:hypothetical protein As57867_012641 [Aphanomyces stellatus]VFT89538.1 Aste57867_12688 [Aphanomyces stellatus]